MNLLQKVTQWAEKEDAIKALILQGSRAKNSPVDVLADYDIALFCKSSLLYTESEDWLIHIAPVWVCVKEKVLFQGQAFPTRLVIFEGGIKVDFSFFSLDCLDRMSKGSFPDEYNRGYQILLDKDGLTRTLPKPNYKEPRAKKPSEREFLETVEEFWFEAYHVAIYLKRKDLWSVKFRSTAMHTFLLRMIEWESEAENSWHQSVPPHGKWMVSWVQPSLWQELQGVFARFDAEDSWPALEHTMSLFRRIAIRVSHQLGLRYPELMDKRLSEFIRKLKEIPSDY